jgi:hypothetical protein
MRLPGCTRACMRDATVAPADRTFARAYTGCSLERDDFASSWFVGPRRILELLSAGLVDQMPGEISAEHVQLTRTPRQRAACAWAIPMPHLTVTPPGSAHGG